MSIAKQNLINTLSRIVPDPILRDQLIDLHLGKLNEEQVREIREEREKEAEQILEMGGFAPPIKSPSITNGEAEVSRDRDN
jgi:hypothetical protein